MAGGQTQPKKGSPKKGAPKRASARRGRSDGGPSEHAKKALSQWGKAARYGAATLSPMARSATQAAAGLIQKRRESRGKRPSLLERLNPSTTEKGGRGGTAADKVLSKMGAPGKLASAFSVGSRVVDRMRDGDSDESRAGGEPDDDVVSGEAGAADDGFGGAVPIPIQQSIEVAVPVRVAYGLSTRFQDYPEFIDRVEDVDEVDDAHVVLVANSRGVHRRVEVEIVDERPNQRI